MLDKTPADTTVEHVTASEVVRAASAFLASELGDQLRAVEPRFDEQTSTWHVSIRSRALPEAELGRLVLDADGVVRGAPARADLARAFQQARGTPTLGDEFRGLYTQLTRFLEQGGCRDPESLAFEVFTRDLHGRSGVVDSSEQAARARLFKIAKTLLRENRAQAAAQASA
jgi:hypothetical protein